jgi:hypothetical protein
VFREKRSERKAVLILFCPKHNSPSETSRTTYYNYLRCRTGLACCGRESARHKLTDRKFSTETLDKMSKTRKEMWANKPKQLTAPRNPILYNEWRVKVQQENNFICTITGLRPKQCHAHHLFSQNVFQSLRYNQKNGVLLCAEIHEEFHKMWGYRTPITIDHFLVFLKILSVDTLFRENLFKKIKFRENKVKKTKLMMPISSQAPKEFGEGSETRVYDPERVMELHERMAKRKAYLLNQLNADEKLLAQQSVNLLNASIEE